MVLKKTGPVKERKDRCRPQEDGEAIVLPDVIPHDVLAAAAAGDERVVAGAHWLESARLEYAAVAAFGRQSAELMALAAPAELVKRSHDAALDEVRHARLRLQVARDLLDVPVELGRLCVVPARRDVRLVDIAMESFVGGCIGEGVAAARALQAAEVCTADISRTLAAIADDELRHAALGWSVVGWALREDPTIAASLLAAAQVWRNEASQLGHHRRLGSERFGVLGSGEARRIAEAVVEEIVLPALHQLVAERPLRPAPHPN